MAARSLSRTMEQMLRTFAPQSGDEDFCLLDRFTQSGDEEAFTILLERHGPMVWRTCRRIVRQPADAEDAFQATFLVLCRKARTIRRRESLGGWLYQVASRIAVRARARSTFRPLDESQLLAPNSDPAAAVVQSDLRQFLDESLQRLPERYRVPLVLCCLQGKTLRRAAAELGWAEGTLATRLTRGKELLRAQLLRRNLVLSSAALATFLAQEGAARAVPGSLAQATVKAKSLFVLAEAAGSEGQAGKAVMLAEGTLKAMALTRIKTAAVVLLSVGLLVAGSSVVLNRALAGRQVASDEKEPAQPTRASAEASQVRVDRYGDPLPAGAVARLGTARLRHSPFGTLTTALSADGKILASCGNEIRLWDGATGKLLREIRDGNRSRSYCALLFAPDGRWLAGAGRESVCLWDTATGRRLREFPVNGWAVACSTDGSRLAAPSQDGSVTVWDTATGRQIARLHDGDAKGVRLPAFTADGKGLITMSDNRVRHWDLAEGTLHKTVQIPMPPKSSLVLSPDGQTVAVIPREGTTSLWDAATGRQRATLRGGPARGGSCFAFSSDGQTLAVNETGIYEDPDEISVALWNARTGELRHRFLLPTRYVRSLGFSPDGRTLLTTGDEPVIHLWDAATGKPVLQWPAHGRASASLAFTPDGRSLVSGSLDRTVRLWEVSSGRQLRELAGHRWRCDVVAVAPDGRAILSGGSDGCIRVQDRDGRELRRILLDGPPEQRKEPIHHVLALGVTPDGKTAATWSRNPNQGSPVYHLWDLATGKALVERHDRSGSGEIPQLSPDARLTLRSLYELPAGPAPAAVAGGGGGPPLVRVGVVLDDVATGREVLRMRDPNGFNGPRGFTPDGRALVTAPYRDRAGDGKQYENALRVWELATGKERLTLACGTASYWFQHVAAAPDGCSVATARSDGTIQQWGLDTAKELLRATPVLRDQEPGGDGEQVRCLAFAPDSRLLASGHRDGTILVWDLTAAGGKEVRPATPADDRQLERWWADLAGEDARTAYTAIRGLRAVSEQAVRFLRGRLHPATAGPPDKLRQLIADLDSPQFERREGARKELTALGDQAGPALRTALQAGPSAEQRRSIEQLLGALGGLSAPEALRHLRAIEVLEGIGNPEARDLLAKLARGVAEARLTREAEVSLKRLTRAPATGP